MIATSERSTRSSHDGVDLLHEESDGDEHNNLSSSGRIEDPPTFSCLEPTCFQSQYVDPPDVDGGSGDEAAPLEHHHVLKSTSKHHDEQSTSKSKADNTADKEPGGQRNKQKTNTGPKPPQEDKGIDKMIATSERSTRSSHDGVDLVHDCNRRVVESETSSRRAVPQNNPRAPHEKSTPHVEDVTKKIKCHFKDCESKFLWRSGLIRHVREVHEGHVREVHKQREKKCILCTQCDMKFTRTDHFNSHVNRIHKSRETPLMCQFIGCSAKFLEKHKRNNHEKSKVHFQLETGMFKCHFKGCLSTFSRRENQNRHYKTLHLITKT